MKTNYVEMSLPRSRLYAWLGIKFMLKNGWFVEKSLQNRFRPTTMDWILGTLSFFFRKSVGIQCYNPMENRLSVEEAIISAMIQWQWARHASIIELLYSMNRVSKGEFLVAMGTKETCRVGVEGFHCYPYLTRTEKGIELRETTSFELPKMLKENEGRFWFLELIPK